MAAEGGSTIPSDVTASDGDDPFGGLPAGARVGKYEIETVLGQGGFGITYRARDTQLGRDVALKEYLPTGFAMRRGGSTVVPRSTRTHDDFIWGRERFLDEAKTLALLDDAPGIVAVYDFLEANGTAYMVMALLRGGTLEARLKRDGRLPQPAIEQFLYPLLDGLELVHKAGFLHRDIKPANILIDEEGRPTLIDFGAARVALEGRTQALTAVYTPGYAAPEQMTLSGRQGPWTDIYALSATLYHCVAGRVPVSAMDRATGEAPVPAIEAGKGRYAPSLLAAIDAGLRFKAAERPQAITDLRRVLSGGGVSDAETREIDPVAQTRRMDEAAPRGPAKRPGVGLIAAGLAVLALAGGGAWYATRPAAGPESVEETVRRAEEEGRRQIALAARLREEEAARKAAEEQRGRAEAARRQAEEDERRRIAAEARQRADAEIARKAAEEKAAADAAARKAAEEKAEADDAARRGEEEAARQAAERRAVADAAARREAEEKARVDAEAMRRRDERIRRETEERVRAEFEARRRTEDEARARLEAEVAARRLETERQRVADEKAHAEVAAREKAAAEAKARAEADAKRKMDDEARREAEEKAKVEGEPKRQAEAAEAALRLSVEDRKRAQVALTALGHNTGGTDGAFGPRTRQMIAGWQRAQKAPETGYLTGPQLAALRQQAAPAIARFDEEQRKLDDEAKRKAEDETRARAQQPAPPAQPAAAALRAPAAPVPATSGPDGAWAGELSCTSALGRGDPVNLVVTNGRGAMRRNPLYLDIHIQGDRVGVRITSMSDRGTSVYVDMTGQATGTGLVARGRVKGAGSALDSEADCTLRLTKQ